MKTQIILSILSTIVLGGAVAHADGPVSLQGSDTLAGVITDAIVAGGMTLKMKYVGGGSGNGEKAMVNGEQGIAPMSRTVKAEMEQQALKQGITLVPHVIGLDGLGIFVNIANKAVGFDVPTLAKIWTCEITKWEQIKGSNRFGDIKVYRRNDQSGTTDTFKNLVGVKTFGTCVTVLAETADIAEKTSTEVDSIGYAGLSGLRPEHNRTAPIALDANSTLVVPTAATVRAKTYPLSRSLYIYSVSGARKPSASEQEFLDQATDRSFMDPIIQDNEFFTID